MLKSACDAYTETKHYEIINKMMTAIEGEIEKSITGGKYSCEVYFDADIPDCVRDIITKRLKDKNYSVDMPKLDPLKAYNPYSLMYDHININWDFSLH